MVHELKKYCFWTDILIGTVECYLPWTLFSSSSIMGTESSVSSSLKSSSPLAESKSLLSESSEVLDVVTFGVVLTIIVVKSYEMNFIAAYVD